MSRRGFAVLAGCLAAAVAVRLYVLSGPPSFIPGGDGGEYVSLARELLANGFAVPATNSIYYPGTPWILPPVPVYLLAGLVAAIGRSGWLPFQTVLGLCIAFDVATLVPLWRLSKKVFGGATPYVVAATYVAYPPALYALTWTGYAQIVGTFLFVVCASLAAALVLDEGGARWRWLALGAALGLTALSHDLSAFVVLGALLLLAVFLGVLSTARWGGLEGLNPRAARQVVWSVAVGLPFYLYWYAGRIQWLLSLAPGPRSGPTDIFSLVTEYVNAIAQPVGPLLLVEALFLLPCFLGGVYLLFRRSPGAGVVIGSFFLSPALLAVWEWSDPSFSVLLYYYMLVLSLPLVACALLAAVDQFSLRVSGRRPVPGTRRNRAAYTIGAVLVGGLILANSVGGVAFNVGSHAWFNECFECGSPPAYGQLRVTTSPPTDALIYVNGTAAGRWGSWVTLPPANYSVSFQQVAGLKTPPPETVRVASDTIVKVTASYANGTTTLAYSQAAGLSRPRQFDFGVLYWMAGHVPASAVVVAPGNLSNWGFYVSGYDGNPTIVAHGLQWLSQAQERTESSAAQTLVYSSAANDSLTVQLLREYNVSYVMVYALNAGQVSKYYTLVYSDDMVNLYQVDAAAVASAPAP